MYIFCVLAECHHDINNRNTYIFSIFGVLMCVCVYVGYVCDLCVTWLRLSDRKSEIGMNQKQHAYHRIHGNSMRMAMIMVKMEVIGKNGGLFKPHYTNTVTLNHGYL